MTATTPLWPFELNVRYELLEEAGRGGMGVVYKARDRETGEQVAIKVLRPEIAADRQSADRFINEVRLSRRITHKNVCRVYEFTRAGEVAYLSMEFVDGESLRSILARVGAVNVRKGVQIARQICAALAEAHAQGIVHRDLKPENVMLDRAGNVKVMDFGIARLLDAAATSTGGVMGTPAYMAPEQAEGKAVDVRTDVYALGLVLYELFTGQAAFTGDTPVAIALKQVREVPPPPRTVDPSLPPEVDTIVMRCLEKDPALRYQTAPELDGALATLPLLSPTATTSEMTPLAPFTPALSERNESKGPLGKTSRLPKRRTLLIAAAALAVMAIAGTVGYLTLWRTAEDVPFTSFRLANGLRVLVSEDRSAPTVSVVVTYGVGSRDERQGRRGFAHLFEHMMFAGSLNVGKGEHVALVAGYGGAANGTALYDMTQLSQTLPSNQLDLALFLEADRMRSLKLDDQRLEIERGTVLAEIAQRKENQPYGRANDALFALAYDTPGYERDVLGSSEDMRGATLQEIGDFFKIYYAPNNAVLSIVGDVEADDVKTRVEKYFEHIPAQPPSPVPDLSEPAQTAERREKLEDPFAPARRLYVAYKAPAGSHVDWESLQALVSVIGGGPSSRLNQKLVRESGVATVTQVSIDRRAGPGLATFMLVPSPDRDPNAVLAQFDALVRDIADRGVSDVELTRAKRRMELGRASTLQATRDRALALGEAESKYGDAAIINQRGRRLAAITIEDVQRVAREYLKPERRAVLEIVPAPAKRTPVQPVTSAAVGMTPERYNRAPVSKEVLRVTLPKSRDFTLENGLTVQVAETKRVPLVNVRIDIRGAGPIYDPPDRPGIALMTALMLRNGTARRSGREISEQLDLMGAAVGAGTVGDPGAIYFTTVGLPDTFDQWFPLVAEMILQPSFPADELTIATRSFASEMSARRSTATAAASDLLVAVLMGSERPIVASPESFGKLSADQLSAWHRERFVPQNAVLSVIGDIDAEAVEKAVRAAFAGWARTNFVEAPAPMKHPGERVIHVVDRPGSVQTALMIGGPATNRADADYPALFVGNTVLASPQGGRLTRALREARGWSYNAQGGLLTYKHAGCWLSYADVNSPRTGDALGVFLEEVRRLVAEPVSAAELDDAKRSAVGQFALGLETLPAVASFMSIRMAEGLSTDYWERFPDVIQAVTPDDVRRVAAKYMDPSKAQVVAVGDREQVVPLLTPFGRVEFRDPEGRLIAADRNR